MVESDLNASVSDDAGLKRGERVDQECPHCGKSYDELMGQKALKITGWNPKSGTLYSCSACGDGVTEAEIMTGQSITELIESGFANFDADYPGGGGE